MLATNVRADDKLLCIPDVVGRYLHYAIRGDCRIRAATVSQEGEFRLGSSGEHWRPFEATEQFGVDRPAFEWDAQMRLAAFMTIRVRDAYLNGRGSTSASLLGHTFMSARPGHELDAGALQRYLAEAVWLPSVLVAGPGIAWQRLARQTAIATLRDGPTSVSLQFTFGEIGEITEIFAPARYRSVEGVYVPTPWLVRCWDYIEVDGFRVPERTEVSWVLPDGLFTYWRARVRWIDFEFCSASQANAA
jgi:hypothetical protein